MMDRSGRGGLERKIKNDALVKARETLGLTREEAAEKIGISKQSLGNYENARTYPSYATQKKLCRFYSRNGQVMDKRNVFPEYLDIISAKHVNSDAHQEINIPFHLANECYELNLSGIDSSILVNELLKDLHPRYKAVLSRRYGLNGNVPETLEEVGKRYGITRERVRQLEGRALKELRTKIQTKQEYSGDRL